MNQFADIFEKGTHKNLDELKEKMEAYYYSTGINIYAIDEKGNIVLKCGEVPFLCAYFHECDNLKCIREHSNALKMSEKFGEEYIFSCFANLISFEVPIIYDGILRGALIGGPVLMNYPEDSEVDEMIKKNDLPIDAKGKLLNYIRLIPVVDSKKVRYLSKLLYILVQNSKSEDKDLLEQRKEKMHQQSKIGEAIQEIKANDSKVDYYPYEKEKELLSKLKNGDTIGAKTILNDILGYIFFKTGGDFEIIKARTLELCTLLSRAAVEGGAGLDEIFGINYKFIIELSRTNDIEELSYWTMKVLDRFGESVFKLGNSKNFEIIKKAINYMNENYMNEITLETVANYVHLNSSYFSYLFKQEVGHNFSDYLNNVRIEMSKQLLKNTNNSILDVALSVGYEDQSYYSKVFKKITGMNPKQFKQL